jgi:hypothetical protein
MTFNTLEIYFDALQYDLNLFWQHIQNIKKENLISKQIYYDKEIFQSFRNFIACYSSGRAK